MRNIVILLLSALAAFAQDDSKPTPQARFAGLSWLAGDWSGEMWGGMFHAYYSTPEGGRILSYSRLEKGGKTVFYEFEKFDVQKDRVVYIPFPGGQRKEHFLLTKSSPQRAVFEQPKKDFPTMIDFERDGDTLKITLSDPHNESPKKEVFELKRKK
jgi:hypothetical protein